MRKPGYAERCEEWADIRKRLAVDDAFRAGFRAARTAKDWLPGVPDKVKASLILFGFKPDDEFECRHTVSRFRDGGYFCQECGEAVE
jgi:hypothetical protein